jgi:hypothetical protein
MKRRGTLFAVALPIGAVLLARGAGAAPTQIQICETISRSGSFVLQRDLSHVSGGDCLVLDADFITIDLAGFGLIGQGTGTGIRTTRDLLGIAVRNGTIHGFERGISLSGRDSIVEEMRVVNNSGGGISADGIVRNNTVQGNGGVAIQAGGVVTGNIAIDNLTGIFAVGLVSGNYVANNVHVGLVAVGTVTGNNARGPGHNGIQVFAGSTVSNNTATDLAGAGITVACPANIIGNAAVNNLGGNLVVEGLSCNYIDNLSP